MHACVRTIVENVEVTTLLSSHLCVDDLSFIGEITHYVDWCGTSSVHKDRAGIITPGDMILKKRFGEECAFHDNRLFYMRDRRHGLIG